MIYITADLHFCHNKEFLYGPRGFTNIEDHDETIVKNWNELINDEDEIYIIGDIMLNDINRAVKYFNMLKGKKHIIYGNHDTDKRLELYKSLDNVIEVVAGKRLKYKKYSFWLSHYPSLCDNYDDELTHNAVINLCGHSHTKDAKIDLNKGLIYHCELDAHNMKPITLDYIIEDLL